MVPRTSTNSLKIYTYPIKSLLPTPLTSANVTRQGFPYDRRFMLLKVHPDRLENMHVAYFPEMTLFLTDLILPSRDDPSSGKISVTYRAPGEEKATKIDVPLEPSVQGLEMLEVTMHTSPTKAYDMGRQYNAWFSSCFGYDVILAYLGGNARPVLGNLSPNAANEQDSKGGWLSSMTGRIPYIGGGRQEHDGITFADVAPFLVVTETSLKNVSERLPDGEEMDITKFRPNIVVSGSLTEYEEDFWGEIQLGKDIRMILTQNCGRCQSINIDYATGKPGKGEEGTVLKKLMKDRRVDAGKKYSPIFGRYGFLDKVSENPVINIGDEVKVVKKNEEHTKFGKQLSDKRFQFANQQT